MDFTGDKIYKCGDELTKIYKCGEVVWSANTEPEPYLRATWEDGQDDAYFSGGTILTAMVETNHPDDYTVRTTYDWIHITNKTRSGFTVEVMENIDIDDYDEFYKEEMGELLRIGNIDLFINNVIYTRLGIYQAFDFYSLPLCIKGADEIYWMREDGEPLTIEYRKNYGEWIPITSSDDLDNPIEVDDAVIQFRGNNAAYGTTNGVGSFFEIGSQSKVYGNIMSLIDSTGYSSATTLEASHTFQGLFKYNDITSAEYLILPATALTESCYNSMFEECRELTVAPEIPNAVFQYGDGCFNGMFLDCEKLSYVKCLIEGNIGWNTDMWLDGVADEGVFVKSPNKNDWPRGGSGIPEGWTIEEV